jgi:hypothetical protein
MELEVNQPCWNGTCCPMFQGKYQSKVEEQERRGGMTRKGSVGGQVVGVSEV